MKAIPHVRMKTEPCMKSRFNTIHLSFFGLTIYQTFLCNHTSYAWFLFIRVILDRNLFCVRCVQKFIGIWRSTRGLQPIGDRLDNLLSRSPDFTPAAIPIFTKIFPGAGFVRWICIAICFSQQFLCCGTIISLVQLTDFLLYRLKCCCCAVWIELWWKQGNWGQRIYQGRRKGWGW